MLGFFSRHARRRATKVGSVVALTLARRLALVVDFRPFTREGALEPSCGGVDRISDCRVAPGVDARGANAIVRGSRVGVDAVVNDGGATIGSPLLVPRVSSFTRSAYRSVLSVCSHEPSAGEMFAIITVRESPKNESRSTSVSFDPRNGTCDAPESSARMHSFSASRDLLISAPSMRVCRSLSVVSAPRSLPAKSIKESLPKISVAGASFGASAAANAFRCFNSMGFFSTSCNIACDRDDSALAPVLPTHRAFVLCSTSRSNVSSASTRYSCNPTTQICDLESSSTRSFRRPLSKSKTRPP